MNPFATLLTEVHEAVLRLARKGSLPAELPLERITVEPPREREHGDAATNAALILAKPARLKPLVIAELLAAELAEVAVLARAEAVPPGFVNMTFTDAFVQAQVAVIIEAGEAYGRSTIGRGERVNVEFCSANPTGPLHVGHGRGTVFGDALAELLAGSLLGCLPLHGRDPDLLNKMRAGETLQLVGGGYFLQQPIFAPDLAALILSVYGNQASQKQIFCSAGPEIIESKRYYQIIAELLEVELRLEEIAVDQYWAQNPDRAWFLCHRLYDLSKLQSSGLHVPATSMSEGLRQHVASMD